MSQLFNQENIVKNDSLMELKEKVKQLKQLNRSLLEKDDHICKCLIRYIYDCYLGNEPPIELLENLLSFFKQEKQKIITDDIPSIMQSAGLGSFTLDDGAKITLKKEVNVSVEDRNKLVTWLIEEGYGEELKDNITFPKGMFDDNLKDFLEDNHYSYKQQSDIHWKTLQRIMKERIQENENLPPETIAKISQIDIAKIKE